MPDLGGPRSVDDALADLARRRRDRWIVAVVLLSALLVAIVLIGIEGGSAAGAGGAALALGAVGTVFVGAVVVEERRDRRLVRTLVAEQGRAAGRAARIAALEALEVAEREVLDVHDLPGVFDRLLVAALGLVDAEGGIVVLRAGGVLTVAAARGSGVPEPGSVLGPGTLAAAAFEAGHPLLGGRGSAWGSSAADSSLAAPLRLPDRGIGVLILVRGAGRAAFAPLDLTIAERFARHAALTLRSANRLDAARESADEVHRSVTQQREAVADLAHGLRAPLAASTGFLQALDEGAAVSTPDRRRAGIADTRAELAAVVDGVEALARALVRETWPATDGAGDQVVDLAALVRRLARTGRGLAVVRGQAASPEVSAPGPVLVNGDEVALRRLVVELLDNALTHGAGPVEVSVVREGDVARLMVRDHGTDAATAVARIVEALAQRRVGQGLGVAARAAERHGGRLEVAMAEGGGVQVRCGLPIGHP